MVENQTNITAEDIAAVKIQAFYRRYLDRKKYIDQLYDLYEKEEAFMLEKTLQQVEEGELLIKNHQLEVEIADNNTTWRNRSRQMQQEWQQFKYRDDLRLDNMNSPVLLEVDDPVDVSDSSNDQQAMSVSSPDDGDSTILDDYCAFDKDMGEGSPLQAIDEPQLTKSQSILREPHETDEEFKRRKRKINYLSLAQEFAALKKIDSSILPFDMHLVNAKENERSVSLTPSTKHNDQTVDQGEQFNDKSSEIGQLKDVECLSPNQSSNKCLHVIDEADTCRSKNHERVEEFDIYNIESAMPQLNWDLLEEHLNRAAGEGSNQKVLHPNDREEIRRRLAMADTDEEGSSTCSEHLLQKRNLQTRLQIRRNLQICFMKQTPVKEQNCEGETTQDSNTKNSVNSECQGSGISTGVFLENFKTIDSEPCTGQETEGFLLRQASLQAEARMALAQVRPMAHMQLEVEKQLKKKSPISEIVGIPGFGAGEQQQLSLHSLQQMNIAQLQVVVNDLHGQIGNFNEELVKLLVERDDLHMAQDSMLVDIEDLTRAETLGRLTSK